MKNETLNEDASSIDQYYIEKMHNPFTGQEFTERELLLLISEDVGRLSRIERTLQEEGQHLTIYGRIRGIELRAFETVELLFSIKKMIRIVVILMGLVCFLLLIVVLK